MAAEVSLRFPFWEIFRISILDCIVDIELSELDMWDLHDIEKAHFRLQPDAMIIIPISTLFSLLCVYGEEKYGHHLGNEASNGWPLGLMNTRFRVMETIQDAPAEPYSSRIRSSSFSSFSSSNLDTESTASFFQDSSVPLGRLIGIRPGNGGLYFPRRVHADEREKIAIGAIRTASSEVSGARRADISQGICIPLLVGTLEKMSRSRSKSRQ
ncbi:hypothetical protein DKX38_005588 [Salix brachista]|uniref:Uncharacterized protein n=1 Tax=Salix brachista TaxID=2182728 RepID=A0A5N5N2F5_9ROSI|nr:hypothetical protein DKX38_005588 [Salix brachista]